MKKIEVFLGIIVAILVFATCTKDEPQGEISVPPFIYADCAQEKSGIIDHFSRVGKYNEIFLIRGIVNEQPVENTGRKIIVVSDLKGNFKDNSTIIVWGNGGGTGTPYNEFGEGLWQYSPKDELILLIMKSSWTADDGIEREYYCVRGCDRAVLKYSNGNVIGGIINGYAGWSDVPADTMPYEEFIGQINSILASYEN
jgi:hypothetical protein